MPTTGKVITCRAAVTMAANTPFVIKTVTVDPPKAGEVRVKLTSTGLCHSDLHLMEGINKDYIFPTIFGHEGAGIIESVGAGVTDFAPGDPIVFLFEGYCGKCDLCLSPKTNKCRNQPFNALQRDGTTRIHLDGKPLTQLSTISTFSEYTTTSVDNIVKVNPKAPMNRLCIAGCCIPTGYGAVVECAKVKPGSTCAIWGLGGVGMNVVIGCKASKAGKIIGIDLNSNKFDMAKEFGCTDVINPKDLTESVPKTLEKMTNGGVDYCFVSVGLIPVMEQAFDSSHPYWGETIIIGLSDFTSKMRAGVWDLLLGRKLKGTYYGSYKGKFAVPGLVDKVVEGFFPLDKLVTHVFPLDKINEGYKLMQTGEAIRAIIDFDVKQ